MRQQATFFLCVVLTCLQAASVLGADAPAASFGISVKRFGAVGDGKAKDTAALQNAIDAVHEAGGGTVALPAGTYLTGTLFMKSRVTVYLAPGAVLLGSTDVADYPLTRCKFPSRTDRYCARALIWGEGLHDIAIIGRGTIDGQGARFKGKRPSEAAWNERVRAWRDAGRYAPNSVYIDRPYGIRFVTCRNILIEGITLRNSAMWMQHYLDCDFVTIRGITVYNHAGRNNDMIDIDCTRNVIIADCVADTDDDALTLKSTAGRLTENVTVTNCILSSHCNAIKAGTESNGGFRNITITNCVVRPSADAEPMAGRREGLAGIALEIVDGGTLDGVTISNITIEGETAPIFLRLGNRARPFTSRGPKPPVGTFRNVSLSNIIATGGGTTGGSITGLPGHPIENVTLSDIRMRFVGGGTAGQARAVVPEQAPKYPECTMFGTLPAYGLYCRHVNGLTLRNVDLDFAKPDARPALVCDDVRRLSLETFNARTAPNAPAQIVLHNTQDALIRGCRPHATTTVFLRLANRTRRVTAVANDLSRVKTPFAFDETTAASALFVEANRMPN